MRNLRVALAFIALSSSTAVVARADGPNLLVDPAFKSNLTGWTKIDSATVSTSWVRTDFKGNPGSGSAKLFNAQAANYSASHLYQCVPAAPGSYVVRGSAWVNGGVATDGVALAIAFYSGPGCTQSLGGFGTPWATAKAWTAIGTVAVAPPGTVAASINVDSGRGNGASPTVPLNAYVDDVYLGTGTCAPGPSNLCLLHGRFKVSVSWTATSQPQPSTGNAVSLSDSDGTFWFTSAAAPDLDVRILNGCATTNTFWVFAGGLVSEGVVALTVTDTTTGAVKTYQNAPATTFAALHDTAAFACP